MIMPLPLSFTAYPEDFRTRERSVTFKAEQSKACTQVDLVNSVDVEMPESFIVNLTLDDTYESRIRLSELRSVGQFEIIDDDGIVKNIIMFADICVF